MAMTKEEFQIALPIHLKKAVTPEVMNAINNTLSGPEATSIFKENLLSYASVLREGKFKMVSYINAVRYVSFKLLGGTNIASYSATFPGKIIKFRAQGLSDKNLSSYVHAYHTSKLVNLIMAQTLIPTHVLNAPLFQDAINTQAELMLYAKSEKVRSDAANSLLTHLKPPETKKVELDVGISADKTLDTLRATMGALVEKQKELIAEGTPVKMIAEGALVVNE